MFEAGAFQQLHRGFEKARIGIGILAELAPELAGEKLGVFFVGQTVGRDMLRSEGDGLLKGRFPLRQRLPGKAEHQIDIQVREPGVAQDLERGFRLRGVVFPAQQPEQIVIPGLHTQADPVHSEASEQFGFARRHAAWICFHRPLAQRREIEAMPKTAEKVAELRRRQRSRRPAADENGLRCYRPGGAPLLDFTEKRLAEALRLRWVGALLVESAVGTNPRAERNVNINVPDGFRSWTLDVGR
jgi:hypothetical protein